MRFLIIIFLFSGVLACCCTTTPLTVAPVPTENRQIDSCEVFLRRLRANMIFGIGGAGNPEYTIIGEWAKKSRNHRGYFNIEADFVDYQNCLIGLTHKQLRDLLGKPTSSISNHSYFYIREDTTSTHTAGMLRTGCISITLHDTVKGINYSAGCIRIW